MRTHIKRIGLAAVAVAALAAGAGRASAQTVWGTYEQPLEGRRFETMRALAHYLDEAAQDALAGTVQAPPPRPPAGRRHITARPDFPPPGGRLPPPMGRFNASPCDGPAAGD